MKEYTLQLFKLAALSQDISDDDIFNVLLNVIVESEADIEELSYILNEYRPKVAVKLTNLLLNKNRHQTKMPWLCNHANEVPVECNCDEKCSCRIDGSCS